MSEASESFEAPEITDEAIQGFIENHGGEMPSYHPILQVWREILKPAADEAQHKVTPQYASRITQSYQELCFSDMEDFRDAYFGKVLALAEELDAEITTLDEPFEAITTPEEDCEAYSQHYKNLLREWQLCLLRWEMDWDCMSPHAAVELAAISEVHKMFFGPQGLTAFLDNIKFEFTESDQAELAEALEAYKEGR